MGFWQKLYWDNKWAAVGIGNSMYEVERLLGKPDKVALKTTELQSDGTVLHVELWLWTFPVTKFTNKIWAVEFNNAKVVMYTER